MIRLRKKILVRHIRFTLTFHSYVDCFLGSILSTKKIIRILTKFLNFWEFPQIFNLCYFQNILRKIFRNLSCQLHQNVLPGNFSDFLKNWWVQNFQIFVRKFLRTKIYLDRIEPRCHIKKCVSYNLILRDNIINLYFFNAWIAQSSTKTSSKHAHGYAILPPLRNSISILSPYLELLFKGW